MPGHIVQPTEHQQAYTFSILARIPGLKHGVTRREGPGLAGNMSFSRGPDVATVLTTRARWCQRIGVDPLSLTFARQVHGAAVDCVPYNARGRGATGLIVQPEADALLTDAPGVALATLAADCVPILLADPVQRVVGTVHAGWRGTAADVTGGAVAAMIEHYGSRPQDVLAGIGPSIGPCCYEVGHDVASAVASRYGPGVVVPGTRSDHPYLDLWSANVQALQSRGIAQEHIELAGICTRCHVDQYFSHRAEGPVRGLFAAIIAWPDGPKRDMYLPERR